MKRKGSGWRKWTETDLSLLLSHVPSCWQGSLVVHLSFSVQIGIYPSDFFEFCILLKFAFIDVFLAMLEYSIEPNSHVMAQYFFYFFFHLFPYVSFRPSINFCSQEKFTQRLRNDTMSYGKRKRVATFA